jgi:hypothetical protein
VEAEAFDLVAELAERGRGRGAGEAGADDDDLELALVGRVDQLISKRCFSHFSAIGPPGTFESRTVIGSPPREA